MTKIEVPKEYEPREVFAAGWTCWKGHGPYATREEALRCPVACKSCDGRGFKQVWPYTACRNCEGTGHGD
jgi:DnaJ-class molecular chaperone